MCEAAQGIVYNRRAAWKLRGLSTCKVLDDITSDDRLFQVFAVATGKARSLIIQSRVSGTASAEVKDERSRCRPGI